VLTFSKVRPSPLVSNYIKTTNDYDSATVGEKLAIIFL